MTTLIDRDTVLAVITSAATDNQGASARCERSGMYPEAERLNYAALVLREVADTIAALPTVDGDVDADGIAVPRCVP